MTIVAVWVVWVSGDASIGSYGNADGTARLGQMAASHGHHRIACDARDVSGHEDERDLWRRSLRRPGDLFPRHPDPDGGWRRAVHQVDDPAPFRRDTDVRPCDDYRCGT